MSMGILEQARTYRTIIEAAMALTDDKTASKAPDLFPSMEYSGSLIKAGTRINWNGTIKRAAVDLWDTVKNNPDNTPSLWEDLNYREGFRIIPETITPGTAFDKGERGWWMEVLYESTIDNNVWTPVGYPKGWKIVE